MTNPELRFVRKRPGAARGDIHLIEHDDYADRRWWQWVDSYTGRLVKGRFNSKYQAHLAMPVAHKRAMLWHATWCLAQPTCMDCGAPQKDGVCTRIASGQPDDMPCHPGV